jgi:uncharacterized iron-regulated membrane protein
VTATLGLVLAVIQFSPCAPFRISRVAIYNPYSGWMRWHYVSGLFFGTLALTWVVSGLLSMQPGNWASGGVDAARIQRALAGGTLDLSRLAVPATAAVKNANGAGTTVKELEPIFVGGEPYWVVHGGGSRPIVVPERSLERSRVPFSVDAVKQAVEAAAIGAPAFEVAMLDTYDSYYYPRSRKPPLPVVRVKFDDRDGSWVYIDPAMGRVVAVYTRRGRIERWIYHGLHSLDLPFWYEAPSIRYGALVLLSLGGILLSLTGVVMAGHRVGRNLRHF